MNTQWQQKPHYGNCIMLSPEGQLLCRCSDDKINWYLERDLAEVVAQDPLSIRLKFVPKGLGHANDPYYLAPKENICASCGTPDKLTAHHCVPRCFRRYFPEKYKNFSCHDILLLCVDCHSRYEPMADELKWSMMRERGFVLECGCGLPDDLLELRKAEKALNAIYRYGDVIPPARYKELENTVRAYFHIHEENGQQHPLLTPEQLAQDMDIFQQLEAVGRKRLSDARNFGKAVVSCLTDADIPKFCQMWREHFVSTMNPQFLPAFWRVDHDETAQFRARMGQI